MKKSTLTLLLFILGISSSFSVGAQEAKTVFVNIPDSLCPLLSSVNRADCIDFIESSGDQPFRGQVGDDGVKSRLCVSANV